MLKMFINKDVLISNLPQDINIHPANFFLLLIKVGEWTSALGLNITDRYAFSEGRPPNITLRVLSRIEEPFVMFRKVKT
jgi:hypothetical protein